MSPEPVVLPTNGKATSANLSVYKEQKENTEMDKSQNADVLSAIGHLNDRMEELGSQVIRLQDEKNSKWGRAHTTIAALALIIGIMGTLLLVAEWKGDISARVHTIEVQKETDRQTLDYIRTQGEVNGKALARIEAIQQTKNGR